jgi:hypothetical protein
MYKWYDGLKEPKRFLVFFIPTATLITLFYVGIEYKISELIYSTGIILITLLVSRIIYIHK